MGILLQQIWQTILLKITPCLSEKLIKKQLLLLIWLKKRKKKLDELSLEELKKIEPKLTNDVLKVFDLKNSVNSKKSYGGTAFDNIKKMIMKYKKQK